jgi:hypothetical protein
VDGSTLLPTSLENSISSPVLESGRGRLGDRDRSDCPLADILRSRLRLGKEARLLAEDSRLFRDEICALVRILVAADCRRSLGEGGGEGLPVAGGDDCSNMVCLFVGRPLVSGGDDVRSMTETGEVMLSPRSRCNKNDDLAGSHWKIHFESTLTLLEGFIEVNSLSMVQNFSEKFHTGRTEGDGKQQVNGSSCRLQLKPPISLYKPR